MDKKYTNVCLTYRITLETLQQ